MACDARTNTQPQQCTRAAFTLVELLIVIGIIATMATVLTAAFMRARPNDALRAAALTLAAEMQQLQTFALAGSITDPDAVRFGLARISAAPTEYRIVSMNASCADFGDVDACIAADDAEAATRTLPDRVFFVSTEPMVIPSAGADPVFFVGYDAPRGRLFLLDDAEETLTEARITLGYERSDATRTVVINRISGRIDIE